MKNLKDYENIEIPKKKKQQYYRIISLLLFIFIFIFIFIIVRHQSSNHSSHELKKSSSVHEIVKKSEPVKKEKKIKTETSTSKTEKTKDVISTSVERSTTASEALNANLENNLHVTSEAPQSENIAPAEPSKTEQELRQQAIDEANQKAEEIAQSLASSAQEEGYIVNIERQ